MTIKDKYLKTIEECQSLPAMPAVATQVLEETQRETADFSRIAQIVCADPALASKMLRTVNSSFYGHAHAISTINHALVILGLRAVKTLVLGFSLVSSLSKVSAKGFKFQPYWRRSMHAATAARLLATQAHVAQPESCFLGALLMDMGVLALAAAVGEPYIRLLEKTPRHADLAALERRTIDLDHAEVGGFLARRWRLPDVLATPIAHHHNASAVQDPGLQKISQVLELANSCADVFVDDMPAAAVQATRQAAQQLLNLAPEQCDAMLMQIEKATAELAAMFELKIGPGQKIETILAAA